MFVLQPVMRSQAGGLKCSVVVTFSKGYIMPTSIARIRIMHESSRISLRVRGDADAITKLPNSLSTVYDMVITPEGATLYERTPCSVECKTVPFHGRMKRKDGTGPRKRN